MPLRQTICVTVLAAFTVTSACAIGGGVTPSMFELANIWQYNIIPKSSPRSLVTAFDRYCVGYADRLSTVRPALLDADYVLVPTTRQPALDTYVVDDRRPMVMVAPQAASCAVAAESRTGQSHRATTYVADRFANAREIPPADIGPNVERAWLTQDANPLVVFTMRQGPPSGPATFMIGLIGAKVRP